MLNRTRARLARRSFDYQWAQLPTGAGLLSDDFFFANVDRILSEEELCVAGEWFEGRRVLDAGCGNGRWIEGFLRLGCEVTAFDTSSNGLDAVRERYQERVRTVQGDILRADEVLAGEEFDLVFCWGVIHHTEDPARGIASLTRLVRADGLLYFYLYGRSSHTQGARLKLGARRFAVNVLPLDLRRKLIEWRYGPERAHAIWDEVSTPLNDRFTFEEAESMIQRAGLARVSVTIPHSELFIRADRGASSADPHLLPSPERPFWFERLGEEENGAAH